MDTSDQYFYYLCRTCMNELAGASSQDGKIPQQQCLSIFDIVEEECGSLRIAELLTNAVPQIEVQTSDELPKRICSKCLQQLLAVYRFQQMCIKSDQQIRQQVSKNHIDLKIPTAAMKGEIGKNDADSYHFTNLQSSSTQQNLENTSIQEPLLECTEQLVKPEAAGTSDADIDQLLEECRDAEGNLSEFVKNEPMEYDEPSIEYSDAETTYSANSVKDEVLSIESEEQQITETNVKAQRIKHDEDKLTHGDEKPYKCHLCEKSCSKISNLRAHIRRHTGEKPYKCKYCERSFSQNHDRMKHMRIHLGENVYRCELCPLAFPVGSELRVHLTTHKNEDPETRERNMKALKEAETKLEINSKEHFKKHRNTHVENNRYECPYCSQSFFTKSNMLQHKRIHEGDNREVCDICGKSFGKRNIEEHKLTHGEKVHKCDLCEKSFVTITQLRVHMRKHTGEKPYKCKYCERSFYLSDARIKHMRVHLGDNIHRCELCPLAFPLASKLRVHLTTHKNEDPETRERNMKALKEAEAELKLKLSQQQPKENVKAQRIKHDEDKLTHGDEKPYKCHLCEKSCSTISNLRAHIRRHTGEKPYKCKYCERSFSQNHDRMKHMRIHLGENVYRCELCPLAFPVGSELRVHLTTHKNEDPETRERNMKALKEAETKLEINSKEHFKKHRNTHVENNRYECPYCSQSFFTKSNMLQHKRIHEGDNREVCDICGKSFGKRNIEEHKLTHGEKVHKCDLCEKSFVTITQLRVHMRKHTGEKPYKCKYCERSFYLSDARIKHMRVHLGDNIHRCELCPLAFPLASKLRVHLTTHKNEDPETRERNMKALKEAEAELKLKLSQQQPKEFKKHHLIRGEDKHYECPHCPRRLSSISNMYNHIATHEGLKGEVCDICGKSFRKSNIKQHKLIHSNEKAHKCDFCEKRFNKISNLRVHIRTHTGEKPYKCKYCERSYSSPSHRINHMRVHLGDNVHRCELCPLAFPLASKLREHFTTHKNEDLETRERNMKALKEAEAKLGLKAKE